MGLLYAFIRKDERFIFAQILQISGFVDFIKNSEII